MLDSERYQRICSFVQKQNSPVRSQKLCKKAVDAAGRRADASVECAGAVLGRDTVWWWRPYAATDKWPAGRIRPLRRSCFPICSDLENPDQDYLALDQLAFGPLLVKMTIWDGRCSGCSEQEIFKWVEIVGGRTAGHSNLGEDLRRARGL